MPIPEDIVERVPGNVFDPDDETTNYWIQPNGAIAFRHYPLTGSPDVATFRFYRGGFAKDRKNCYCTNTRLAGGKGASFRALNYAYYTDGQSVWCFGGKLKDADAASFVVCDDGVQRATYRRQAAGYARDKSRVFHYFYEGKAYEVPKACVETFVSLNDGYFGHDHVSVYYGSNPLPKANLKHWRRLGSVFSKDDARIYFANKPMKGVDYDSFEVVSAERGPIARDRHHYYHASEIIEPFRLKGTLHQMLGGFPFDPRWLTTDVVTIAKMIRNDLAFSHLAILCDALMDAGCEEKQIIEACKLGAELKLASFVVDLILFKDSQSREPPKVESHTLKCLLVVDDTETSQKFEWYIETLGYPVRIAQSSKDALKMADEWDPDCIFLSLNIPAMDGFTIARRIRQQSPSRNIYLIALAAAFTDAQLQKAGEAGFNTHLVKSAGLEEVKSMLLKVEGTLR